MPDELPPESRAAMEQFGKDARVEARMLDPDKDITDSQRAAVIREISAYRDRTLIEGRPVPWSKLANWIGVSPSVLTEVVKSKYQGDTDKVLRQIDQFLAREANESKRPDLRGFQQIKVTEHILAAINQCVLRRSIGVISGEPGSGKSKHAEWFRDRHEGAVLIVCDDADSDRKFVIDALHEQLRLGTYTPSVRQRKREIEQYLKGHLNTVIIIDEAQKLTADGLETLRGLHDKSDPDGRRNVPIILFGDDSFYKDIQSSRGGSRTKFSSQLTRRMFPVILIEVHCADLDPEGRPIPGSVYTVECIERIVRSQRLRLVRNDAMMFAVGLANVHNKGRLGLAQRVIEIAIDLAAQDGKQVTVAHMRAALSFFRGPSEAQVIEQQLSADPGYRRAVAAG